MENKDELCWECENCEERFKFQSQLDYHKINCKWVWMCDYCEKEFISERKLNKHMKKCKEDEKKVSFNKEDIIRKNERYFTSNNMVGDKCEFCGENISYIYEIHYEFLNKIKHSPYV